MEIIKGSKDENAKLLTDEERETIINFFLDTFNNSKEHCILIINGDNGGQFMFNRGFCKKHIKTNIEKLMAKSFEVDNTYKETCDNTICSPYNG